MALQKDIILDNGITVSYHRVESVGIITNDHNSIQVNRYCSKASRDKQKEDIEKQGISNVYMDCVYYDTDYDQTMTVDDAYAYLKTLPEYEGAIDV